MIEVTDLTKRYGDITAIDHVSFRVEQGEILGFLGPNGAGKSTTMRILTGALGATSGKAIVAGYDVSERPREAKKRFGYLPELPPVYPEMTVAGYVDFAARLHGVERGKRKEAVGRALELCGLSHVAGRLIGHLSKGYQQRVGLAQSLVHDPPVLILDEPTVGLDPNQITEVRRLIRSLAGRHTIILSTHILPEVQMTCQRVVIINKGRIVAQDTIENLSSQVQKNDRISLLVRQASPDAETVLKRIPGVQEIEVQPRDDGQTRLIVLGERGIDIREELAKVAVGQGWGLLELGRVAVSLEEVFHELTTEEQGVTDQAESAQAGVSA